MLFFICNVIFVIAKRCNVHALIPTTLFIELLAIEFRSDI